VVAALVVGGCLVLRPSGPVPRGLRDAADLAEDPARRASLHLAARAEDARVRGDVDAGRALAEQALSLDGENPYAYLVLARNLADTGDRAGARRAALLAEGRFEAEEPWNRPWMEQTRALLEELREDPVAGPPAWDTAPPGTPIGPVIETER
jgi:hypothetical protein